MLQCSVLKSAINVWENEGGGLPPLTDTGASLGSPLFPPHIRVGHGRAYARLTMPRAGALQKENGEP
jgi:hypothetical protein